MLVKRWPSCRKTAGVRSRWVLGNVKGTDDTGAVLSWLGISAWPLLCMKTFENHYFTKMFFSSHGLFVFNTGRAHQVQLLTWYFNIQSRDLATPKISGIGHSVSVKWKQKTRATRACTDNIPAFPFFKGIKRMKPGWNDTARHAGLCALVLTVTYIRIPVDWIHCLGDVLKICCRNISSYKSCLYNFCKFAQRLKFDFLKMQPTWNSAVTHLEMRLQQAFEQHAIKKRGSWCNSL